MKRLHIVGKSPDNRRLYLAQAKGAKFGSFEIPISSKLLKLVHEAEDARRPKPKAEPGAGPDDGDTGAPAQEERAAAAATAGKAEEPSRVAPRAGKRAEERARPPRATKASEAASADSPATAADEEPSVRVVRRRAERAETAPTKDESGIEPGDDIPLGLRGRRGEGRSSDAEAETPPPQRGAESVDADGAGEAADAKQQPKPERPLVRPRTRRPQIPARSKLSPAEIQALIRAGRAVRSIAELAGTPTEWVKWLAQPVQQERRAIVANALRERQTRARLGASAEPLGVAVALNLRSRGVSGADRVVEEGFTAVRSNGREWRVRLSFEQRGRRTSAVWGYDPQRHALTPLNTLASQLGWRRPRAAASSGNGDATERRVPRSPRKSTTAKKSTSRRTISSKVSTRRGRGSR